MIFQLKLEEAPAEAESAPIDSDEPNLGVGPSLEIVKLASRGSESTAATIESAGDSCCSIEAGPSESLTSGAFESGVELTVSAELRASGSSQAGILTSSTAKSKVDVPGAAACMEGFYSSAPSKTEER